MQFTLRCMLSLIVIVLLSTLAFSAENDSVYLRNVYEIAREIRLFKDNPLKYSPQNKLRLLGAISKYTYKDENENSRFDTIKYHSLGKWQNELINNVISYEIFYKETIPIIENVLNDYQEISKDIKNRLLKGKSEYVKIASSIIPVEESLKSVNAQRQLNELSKKTTSDSISLFKNKLAIYQNANAYQRDSIDTINPSRFYTDSLELISKINLNNKYLSSLLKKDSLLNLEDSNWKNELQKLVKSRDSVRSDTDSVLKANSVVVFNFLRKLNGLNPLPNPDISTLLENSYGLFSKSSEINIQAVISQIESSARSSFRIPSQSEVIDALAIYLAGRIKQEAVMWFFETITKSIKSYPLIRDFFPNTCVLLESREVYEIPNLGTQWRYALSKDFLTMPKNVFRSSWFMNKWPKDKLDISYISGACDMAEMLTKHYSFRETIQALYLQQPQMQNDKLVFQDFVNLLYLVNNELVLPDSKDGYRLLRYEDYRNMNREEMELMLSLLDIRYKGVFSKFLKGMDERFSLENRSGPVTTEKIRQWLGNIQMVVSQIERVRMEYVNKSSNTSEEAVKTFYNYHSIWESFTPLWELFITHDANNSLFNERVLSCKNIFSIVNKVQEVYGQIDNKNFAGAVQNMLSLIDTLFYGNWKVKDKFLLSDIAMDEKSKKLAENSRLVKSLLVKENVRIAGSDKPESRNRSVLASVIFEEERHAMELVRTLAGFLNDVALAKSDKQLSKVVESYALPAGSYKRKRNNWWSIDLNAFAGPYFGYEWVKPDKELSQTPKVSRPVFGFSVPIGLSFSKTFGRKLDAYDELGRDEILNPDKVKLLKNGVYRRTRWTVTTTISLIDIGAVVSYRLKSSADTALPQEVKWAQVFSPGIHVGIAIPNTPLVVSTGLVYAPQLRKFKDDNSIINSGKQYSDNYNTVRMYAGLFFDIPLFNLWERKRIVYR